MMDTYRVRHAVRDVGAALGLPPGEIDALAKAFPHIRARDARAALRRPARAAGQPGIGSAAARPACSRSSSGSTACPGTSRCTRAGCCCPTAPCSTAPRSRRAALGFPMSQFDKDDVEDLGLLKLDVLGIRMQSSMAHAVARGPAGRRRAWSTSTRSPLDDAATFDADPLDAHPRLLPDRVARPARAGRQVRPGDLRRPHHRHLAVPARPGEVRHGHPVPARPAGLGDRRSTSTPTCEPALAETYGVVVFHEQVLQIVARDDRLHAGRGRRGAPRARRSPTASPRSASGSTRARSRQGYALRSVEQVWEVLRAFALVRVLQGPRRGVRAADLPVGLAQGAPPGGVPGRGAHPRPGHVPQAADPRRRPPARDRGAAARRQRLRRAVPGRAGRPSRRAAAGHPRQPAAPGPRAGPRSARRSRLRHPARAGRRQGHQRGRGRPDRRRPAVRLAVRLLAPGRGCPGRSSSGWSWPGRSTRCTASAHRSRSAGAAR